MSGDAHVRICESLGVQFPRATRLFVSIRGKRLYLWRAVDREGEVLDILVQARRNKKAALKLMRKLLKKQGFAPSSITTDKLRSYSAALHDLDLTAHHETGQ
jgi:transposase-like protein